MRVQTRTRDGQVKTLETRYRTLQRKLTGLGYIVRGSLVSSFTRCGTPGCRCAADPPQLHGPYWTWTRSEAGKTITRRLSPEQATHYRRWIANARRHDAITAQMEKISRRAAELLAPKPARR
jgi:hypothetical protein